MAAAKKAAPAAPAASSSGGSGKLLALALLALAVLGGGGFVALNATDSANTSSARYAALPAPGDASASGQEEKPSFSVMSMVSSVLPAQAPPVAEPAPASVSALAWIGQSSAPPPQTPAEPGACSVCARDGCWR